MIVSNIPELYKNNRRWAEEMTTRDPDFFKKLQGQQAPEYLWIGCSDSRVPANEIVGLLPGELFVHRNVANLVVHSDFNCLSVLQFAVDVLKVKHVIVCGHYGCGGVQAAYTRRRIGLVDNWLRHVQEVSASYSEALAAIENESDRIDRLCELNVIEQVANVCKTTVVRDAWRREQPLSVHGWIYSLGNGLLRDLQVTSSELGMAEAQCEKAVGGLV